MFSDISLVSELLLRFLKCCWVFEISSCFTERCCLFNFVDMFLKCSKMAPRGHRIYLPAVSKNWRKNLILIINNKDYICSFISGIADERKNIHFPMFYSVALLWMIILHPYPTTISCMEVEMLWNFEIHSLSHWDNFLSAVLVFDDYEVWFRGGKKS